MHSSLIRFADAEPCSGSRSASTSISNPYSVIVCAEMEQIHMKQWIGRVSSP